MKIYLAGASFSSAEREWNRLLANNLRMKHEVLLPQEFCSFEMNPKEIADCCLHTLCSCDIIVVNCDGADMDSGTSMEFGYALAKGKPSVAYRTDYRKAGDSDNNVNMMVGEMADAFVHRQLGAYSEVGRDILGIIQRWDA